MRSVARRAKIALIAMRKSKMLRTNSVSTARTRAPRFSVSTTRPADYLPSLFVSALRSDVARIEGVMMRDALEIRGVVRIALSHILGTFGIGAERPLECHALGRNVVHVMRCDDPVRSDSLLDPALQALHQVVVRIDHRPVVGAVADCDSNGPAAAVLHSRPHEDTVGDVRV